MKSCFNINKRGFTLIELLVVISIIIIISAIVIFDVGFERQSSALLRSSQKLSLDLRRAQSFALSSKIYKTSGAPCGWGAHFNGLGSTNYIIFADMAAATDCSNRDFIRAADGSEDFETINFDAGININSLSNNLSDIVFSPPEPTVNLTPDQTSISIVLINKNGATRTININKTGFISSP